MTRTGKTILMITFLLAALLLGAGTFMLMNGSFENIGTEPVPQTKIATVFPKPQTLSEFSIIDHNGNSFGNNELLGQWHFMFFGYTHCPDVCPTTLSIMNSVAKKLGENANTRFLFVTVDPKRDTPERLTDFVRYFNPNFVGLTGDLDAILGLSKTLGIMSSRDTGSGNENYNVEHTASILLLNPNGEYAALFSPPHSASIIARDFNLIEKYYRTQ